MKRSTTATLLLMSAAPLCLTACDQSPPPNQIHSQSFPTVAACTQAGNPQADCQRAFDQAQASTAADAPHFKTREDCIREFGPDMCQERSDAHEGSFWGPLMAGFMISRMLNNNTPSYYGSQPLYRQRDGQYVPSSGSGDSYGRTASTPSGSADAGSRAVTASRGGFGSASAARGGWGG